MKRDASKEDILRESGTLNPRPEDVRDEQFLVGDFFDSRDLVQVKYEMLRRARDGRPITEAAAMFGLSRPSFYKARVDFEESGLSGLIPKKRGPRAGHKITPEVLEFLVAAMAEDGSLDPSALAHMVEERYQLQVHPRSIRRALDPQAKKKR